MAVSQSKERKKIKNKKTIAYDFKACVALHVMGRLHWSPKQKLWVTILVFLKSILCIYELSIFEYILLSVLLIFSFLFLCYVKILDILKRKKIVNKQYIVKKICTVQLSLLVPFTLRGRKDPVTWTNGQHNLEAMCGCHSQHLKLI